MASPPASSTGGGSEKALSRKKLMEGKAWGETHTWALTMWRQDQRRGHARCSSGWESKERMTVKRRKLTGNWEHAEQCTKGTSCTCEISKCNASSFELTAGTEERYHAFMTQHTKMNWRTRHATCSHELCYPPKSYPPVHTRSHTPLEGRTSQSSKECGDRKLTFTLDVTGEAGMSAKWDACLRAYLHTII